MDRAGMVASYLRGAGGVFRRGVADCATFADRWVETLTGQCVAADILRPMGTARALRIILAEGGLIAAASRRLAAAGWQRVPGWQVPEAGDVALFAGETALGGESVGIVAGGGTVWTLDERGDVCRWPGEVREIMRWPAGGASR